jgi:hypothetical protein
MPILAPDELIGKDFDRVVYHPPCRHEGRIEAVWLSLTKVVLEGRCNVCSETSLHQVDLLEVDKWLKSDRETRPRRPDASLIEDGCGL